MMRMQMMRKSLQMKHPEAFDSKGNFIRPTRTQSGTKKPSIFKAIGSYKKKSYAIKGDISSGVQVGSGNRESLG